MFSWVGLDFAQTSAWKALVKPVLRRTPAPKTGQRRLSGTSDDPHKKPVENHGTAATRIKAASSASI